ncbi:hypothetical protein TPB0596_23700 [Tsukamurella pulmonis]|uniref:PE-PPE domain-containing protein n=1 Tax=Tsukamurella pulmonis TaxID=47312 RepID=UPI001EDCD404|nr:PE-PPE domain-containing protein [Tsukamurella pulmonis]BDD82607.1 hypothetical protein TPB0596_23700 [Tsukamurella pulmonis]
MTTSHALRRRRPIALAVAGTGLAGALALTGGGVDLLAAVAAKTVIVVGGANDPTGKDQWTRIGGQYTGPAPVFVQYPAVFGVGFPGFALSSDGVHTYARSIDIGATATVDAIAAAKQNPDEEVVVYTISQGSDVVGVAVLRYGRDHPRPSDGSAGLTFVEQGGPSFIRSGAWSVIPAGIPGLHAGPIRNDGASGATVVSICVKGDIACGMGLDPVRAMVYLVPGFLMHGTVYTAENIGRYSPLTGEAFTPGSVAEAPVATRTEFREARTVTVDTYADGTIKRTWIEDGTTWVSIDQRENPWGWLLRRSGLDVPLAFDRLLSAVLPVPEPGESGLEPVRSSSPTVGTVHDPAPSPARHREDRPDAVPVAQLLAASSPESPLDGPIADGAVPPMSSTEGGEASPTVDPVDADDAAEDATGADPADGAEGDAPVAETPGAGDQDATVPDTTDDREGEVAPETPAAA